MLIRGALTVWATIQTRQRDEACESESTRLLKSRYFAALVRSPVRNGHVGLPHLIEGVDLP